MANSLTPVLMLVKPAWFTILPFTLASAILFGGCGIGAKKNKKDAKENPKSEVPTAPEPPLDSEYPNQIVRLTSDELSILPCQEDGVTCKTSAVRVMLISELLSARETQLGIPALTASQVQLQNDLTKNEERRIFLKDLQTQSTAAEVSVSEINPKIDTLNIGIEDLQTNLAAIDSQLQLTPTNSALLAQREVDAQTLADKQSDLKALASEKGRLVELISGKDARNVEIENLLTNYKVKSDSFNSVSKELAGKKLSLETDIKVLAALPKDFNIKLSELEAKLPWLMDIVAIIGVEK